MGNVRHFGKRHRPTFAGFTTLALLGGTIAVIDADTVEQDGQRWRLTGLDAPEIHRARCPEERRRGILAAAHLIGLLAISPAELVPAAKGAKRDKYGRRLGRLLIDGQDWAGTAISAGHAVAWDGAGRAPTWCGEGT